eukprot:6391788-Prymnesium_polylepis.1
MPSACREGIGGCVVVTGGASNQAEQAVKWLQLRRDGRSKQSSGCSFVVTGGASSQVAAASS